MLAFAGLRTKVVQVLRDAAWKAAHWLVSRRHLCHTVYHPNIRNVVGFKGSSAECWGHLSHDLDLWLDPLCNAKLMVSTFAAENLLYWLFYGQESQHARAHEVSLLPAPDCPYIVHLWCCSASLRSWYHARLSVA